MLRLLFVLFALFYINNFVFAQGYLRNDGLTTHTSGITINEISALSNPTDFNADGLTNSTDKDEFIEIVNNASISINVGGWTLGDNGTNYLIPSPTIILPQHALVVFTRLSGVTNFNPGSGNIVLATSGASILALANTGDAVGLRNTNNLYISASWGSGTVNSSISGGATLVGSNISLSSFSTGGQSQTRFPDYTGGWIQHPTITGTVNWSVDGLITLTNPQGSPGRFAGTDITLPVEMTSFTASAANDGIRLRWQTASEVENLGFEVQRSDNRDGPFTQIAGYQNDAGLRGAGTSSEQHNYSFTDPAVFPGQLYWYQLADVDVQGNRGLHGPVAAMIVNSDQVRADDQNTDWPQTFAMNANYPNPFNLSTNIPVTIPALTNGFEMVSITVHDITGRQLRTLHHGNMSAGNYIVNWDGRDEKGKVASAGLYFVQFTSPSFRQSIKMILLK